MKIFCLILCFLIPFLNTASSLDAICSYEQYRWLIVGQIYFCKLLNRLNINSPEQAVIRDAEGTHTAIKTGDDVLGFYALNKSIEYFPRGLEKMFKNLKLINIQHGRIKEIHQADLKPFSKLEYLALWENDIEVIEDGLFEFNPDLAYVYFEKNKIFEIHPKAFDYLTKMTFLDLQSNQCIDMYAKDNSAAVKEIIKEAKSQCASLPIKNLFNHVKNVNKRSKEIETKLPNFEFGLKICQNSVLNLNQKILNLEKGTKAYLVEAFTKIKNVEENLKAPNSENSNGKILIVEQGMKNLELSMTISKMESSGSIKSLNEKASNLESNYEKLENDVKALNIEALQTRVENIEKFIKASEAETAKKIENLEKALKDNGEDFNSFKLEMFTAFEKIIEKLEENSEKFEKKAVEKIDAMAMSLKASQVQAFATLSDKMKSLEDGLSNLQSGISESIKIADETCDTE